MAYVKTYKEQEAYKHTKELTHEIFDITKSFPNEEKYSLIDQMRRSSRPIGAQIAESWGKRRYEKHFIHKLTDADSEQFETQHWLEISFECNYINQELYCKQGKFVKIVIDKFTFH